MHPQVHTHAGRCPRRQGSLGAASVEFAVVVPVLLVLMLGIVYYGMILAMQQALTLAAEEGARAPRSAISLPTRNAWQPPMRP
ncbi:TadE family protein [Cupriavidus basilensis]